MGEFVDGVPVVGDGVSVRCWPVNILKPGRFKSSDEKALSNAFPMMSVSCLDWGGESRHIAYLFCNIKRECALRAGVETLNCSKLPSEVRDGSGFSPSSVSASGYAVAYNSGQLAFISSGVCGY